jgi:hypothetical protein
MYDVTLDLCIKCYTKLNYHKGLYNYLYIGCILVMRHPDDDHRNEHNMLVKNNNMWLNIYNMFHIPCNNQIFKMYKQPTQVR